MTEYMIADATANALGVSPTQADAGLVHTKISQAPHYTELLQREVWIARVIYFINAGRVYRDADTASASLTFGVYAASAIGLSAATGNALTNNQTNYIYVYSAGAVQVTTSGFPATWHVPPATIVAPPGDRYLVPDYSCHPD